MKCGFSYRLLLNVNEKLFDVGFGCLIKWINKNYLDIIWYRLLIKEWIVNISYC